MSLTLAVAEEEQVDAAPEFGYAWPRRLAELGREIFRPLPRTTPLEWAVTHRRWPDGSPYQVEQSPHVRQVLELYANPAVEEITIVKPAQSGLTEGLIVNAIGFHMDVDPRGILVVIPSVDEAEKWSKKKLQPMIDSTERLRGKLEEGARKSSNTILEKTFPGGSVGIVGSNSGKGFRMVTVGTVFGDDVDGWEATAGKGDQSEGDQVTLIRRRTDRTPDRKLVWVSTPTRKGSRISSLFREMERRGIFHVPCPECGEMQVLRWGDPGSPYGLKWESETVEPGYQPQPGEVLRGNRVHRPDTAYYVCEVNGCHIEEKDKVAMEAAGEFLTKEKEPVWVPGVHRVGLWLRGSLTITLPGAEWPRLIREFLQVLDKPTKLQGFMNTVMAEEWEERGEAPEWERLYERRESYPIGICPEGVEFLTVGADVQDNRIEAFVWGWGYGKESWMIDHQVIPGDPFDPETWPEVTALLHKTYPTVAGGSLPIARFAIDTGFAQEAVIGWAYRAADRRVMLVKGDHWKNWRVIVGAPSRTEVTWKGKKTGLQLWPVGGALIKQETYGFLRLPAPLDGQPYPPGWIHIPQVDEEIIKQLVAEDLVTRTDKKGFSVREWVKNRHRNEALDCRVYARAAAEQMGLSRMVSQAEEADAPPPQQTSPTSRAREGERTRRNGGGWLDTNRRRGGWL